MENVQKNAGLLAVVYKKSSKAGEIKKLRQREERKDAEEWLEENIKKVGSA